MDEDLYIFDETDALRALKSMSRPLCLFGHTHFPITFQLAGGELQAFGPTTAPEATVELKDKSVLVVYYTEGKDSHIRARRFKVTDTGIEFLPLEK